MSAVEEGIQYQEGTGDDKSNDLISSFLSGADREFRDLSQSVWLGNDLWSRRHLHYILAYDKNTIVGVAHISTSSSSYIDDSDESIELLIVCVDTNYRKQGIGTALVNRAKEYAI